MTERLLLTRRPGIPLHTFSYRTGLHPDLVRRYVALGLLSASRDAAGGLWFDHSQVPVASQVLRLRQGLGLNYAAVGVVLDLLDRIHRLEACLERTTPWI
jgi:DNA-binding transcriptional MerR regulator